MIEQMNTRVFNEIRQTMGPEYIKKLHQPRPFMDILAVVGLPVLFISNMSFLANAAFGFWWLIAFIFQGFLLQIFGLAAHELFTHRKVLGEKWSYRFSIFYFFLVGFLPSKYYFHHINHHRHLNTNAEPEAYKQDLDTRWKRLALLTLPGILLAISRRFRRGDGDNSEAIGMPIRDSTVEKRLQYERKLLLCYGAVILGLAIAFPRYIIWGYLSVFLITFPIAFSLRIILEHTDVDTNNPLQIATNYRTSALTRFLFFYDSGDCHVIHHIFPKLPFYNMHKANMAIQPILRKYDVVIPPFLTAVKSR